MYNKFKSGLYKVPYSPTLVMKFDRKEYQVFKRGRKYLGCGEENNVEKREKRNLGEGNQVLKTGVGKYIKLKGTLHTPELKPK